MYNPISIFYAVCNTKSISTILFLLQSHRKFEKMHIPFYIKYIRIISGHKVV